MVASDLRTMAEVLAVTAGRVDVEACGGDRCANCPGGCNWGGFRGPRRLSLAMPSKTTLAPGDRVWITLSRASMLRAAAWAYGLPFVGFFAGAGVGELAGGDGAALALACVGLALGWWLGRQGSRSGWSEPRIESRIGPA